MKQHSGYLCNVLSRLWDHILSVKYPKCDFLKSSLYFLSHVISPAGVVPDSSKVSAIRDMATLTDISYLCSFLGCTNFFERFVPQYTTICAPLINLLGSHVE